MEIVLRQQVERDTMGNSTAPSRTKFKERILSESFF